MAAIDVFISSSFHEDFSFGFQKERDALKAAMSSNQYLNDLSLDYCDPHEEHLVLSQDDELYLDDIQEGDENLLNDDKAVLSDQGEIGITDVDEKMEGVSYTKERIRE